MSEKIKEIKEKRAKIVADQQALLDTAETEKRDLTSDEHSTYEKMDEDFEKYTDQISEAKKQQELTHERREANKERQKTLDNVNPPKSGHAHDEGSESRNNGDHQAEYRAAYSSFLKKGIKGLTGEEHRALSAGIPLEGGNTVVPELFMNDLIQSVDDLVFVRKKATKFEVKNAESLGVPTIESDPSDAEWTTELSTGSNDSDMKLGKRVLKPNPVAKRIKVSDKLIRASSTNIDAIVRNRLAYKFGITHEKGFFLGSGIDQPLGLFVASVNGISAGRDIVGDNTSTQMNPDALIDTKYSLKAQYHAKAEWLFHRNGVKQIRKMKDSNNEYLWKQGLSDKPDTILDSPYSMSEYVPNTFTTGQYVGLYGDLSFYWIADALDMTIKVLAELYAESNQIGYIGRWESDGMPVLEEAFARVKLGA
ncbi:MAG: phage major capsid protein [Deltaproteobacteria bacterium]|nr:phage major capsid protein [Deltaproteobacteria bacterium]